MKSKNNTKSINMKSINGMKDTSSKQFSSWVERLSLLAGVIALLIGIIIIILPHFALVVLAYLVGIVLVIIGIERLIFALDLHRGHLNNK
jgi:uncharacterized membrane protein HdeD (DUF308 family)